jgi:PAS domain S-box-containing protein
MSNYAALSRDQLEDRLRALEDSSARSPAAPGSIDVWYQSLFHNMMDEVHVWELIRDNDGAIRNWRLVDINPATERSWGMCREEAIGQTTDEIFSPDALALFMPIVERIFRENAPYTWEVFFPDLGQHLQMTSVPLDDCFISTGTDVTEIKRAQQAAEGAARKEAASAVAIRNTLQKTVDALAHVVEARDLYTAGHEERVTRIAVMIGRELGLTEDRIYGLELAARIHDLGKVIVPADILSKPTRLTAAEYAIVKEHPVMGARFIRDIDFDWPIANIVEQHHERWDGSGYPRKLAGEEILLEARIIAVADTLEAMAHHRPYREALGLDAAIEELREGAGKRYDPAVVTACLDLIERQAVAI